MNYGQSGPAHKHVRNANKTGGIQFDADLIVEMKNPLIYQ
jgi:hypothetical protein